MSNSTSHATQPSESDFLDSHPLDSDMAGKSVPTIGDLTSIETGIDIQNSEIHSVGDLSGIEESPESEILGDISLLDEAFAEMNESEAPQSIALNTSDIPVLSDSIETPSQSRILPVDADNASIPLLDQQATVYAEMLKPLTESITFKPQSKPVSDPVSALASQISGIESEELANGIDDEPLFDSPDAENNANISEMNSALEMAAELLSEAAVPEIQSGVVSESIAESASASTLESDAASTTESSPVITTFEASNFSVENEDIVESDESDDIEAFSEENNDSALEALLENEIDVPEHNDPDIESDISDLQLDIASELSENAISEPASEATTGVTSIDEKIAIATSESELSNEASELEINEMPISAMVDDMSEPSEFPASFAEGLNSSPVDVDDIDSTDDVDTNYEESADKEETLNTPDSHMLTDDLSELEGTEISAFNPDIDLNSEIDSELNSEVMTQTSHTVGITSQGQESGQNQNNLNLSIPFELHSQLSHKIDELVIQATSSITEELHTQLSTRLDDLLSNAVESVLPKLVNQMANELRSDINGRIKQQLPNIVNDVLNKTRLQK